MIPSYVGEEVAPGSVSVAQRLGVECVLRQVQCDIPIVWARFYNRKPGVFVANPSPAIFLNVDLNPQDVSQVIAHEIGHYRHFLDRDSWNCSRREDKERCAEEFEREVMALAPIRSWYSSMWGSDPLSTMCSTAICLEPTASEMEQQVAELQAWRRSMPNRPRVERFRGSSRREYFIAVPFSRSALNLEQGTFRGVASVFGSPVEAYVPTIVDRGAFTKTLENDASRVVILWQHDSFEPIGKPIDMRETDVGLEVTARISKTRRGIEALTLLQDGTIDELSIGFDPVESVDVQQADGSKVRHLKEVRLWEISLVTFAADPLARVTSVPSA